ncbi:MAG: acyltransferase [Novosphingobium sp.]
MVSKPPHRYVALDSLRGLAALGVAAFHIESAQGVTALPIFRAGNQFVDFFFVLSGFVIAASYGERIAQGFPLRKFMALRLGRVWPLHFFMILACLGMELVSVLAGPKLGIDRVPFTGFHSPDHILRALFLADGYFPDRRNYYSGASWSISVEILLYLLAALAFRSGRLGKVLLVLSAPAAMVLLDANLSWPVLTDSVERGFAGFGLGVAVFFIHRRIANVGIVGATLLEGAVLALFFSDIWMTGSGGQFAPVILPSALVVLVMAQARGAVSRMLAQEPFAWLGRISYSIYMVHGLVVTAFVSLLMLASRAAGYPVVERVTMADATTTKRLVLSTVPATIAEFCIIACVLVAAHLAWRWIEEPARQWSRRMAGHGGNAAPVSENGNLPLMAVSNDD